MSFSVGLGRSLALAVWFGFDVRLDRNLGRGLGLDLRLLSALCRCICKFAVARFTFVSFFWIRK